MRRHDLVSVDPGASLSIETGAPRATVFELPPAGTAWLPGATLTRATARLDPAGTATAGLLQAAHDWIDRGRPLVAARQDGVMPDAVRLGLSLPPDGGGMRLPPHGGGRQHPPLRPRLSCLVARSAVRGVRPPLTLRACVARLPTTLVPPLLALAERLDGHGIAHGVYGSLSWEALSGERYRHADSDVDLVCEVSDARRYRAALEALAATAALLPCRLDGELRFPDQSAVAWRELAVAQAAFDGGEQAVRVLVKGGATPALLPLAELLARFARRCDRAHADA